MDAVGKVQLTPSEAIAPGELVRKTRRTQSMTLEHLGRLTGYSAAQVSRYERGVCPMSVPVLRRFGAALDIPPQALGLAAAPLAQHGQSTGPYPRLPAPTLGRLGREDGEDPVRRRKLLANLAATAAAAAGAPFVGAAPAESEELRLGDTMVAGLRDAMLGLGRRPADPSPEQLAAELSRAIVDFNGCDYSSLSVRLPRLIRAAHQATSGTEQHLLLAQGYLLATRVLIKLDEPQLGWMAADRARQLADAGGDPLSGAEAARQLAVLARKAGWHDQSLVLALNAADDPALHHGGKAGDAQRGLLIQCAAYTVAHMRDQSGMRELTDQAAAIAAQLGSTQLRGHRGGFSPATVQLHLISAENSAGDPSAALAAAAALAPQALPSVERQALYYTDKASAYARWGRREECIDMLLAAEYHAAEETHARPAVRAIIHGLLVSGRTTPQLRGLAARTGVLTS
ncbi:helix-turn-helix transcriptional regulator [Streptomyces sp. NPDC002055]|uniref:helix-turn-helix domain-containing protein n=1 Tax=Streptomyces sp. NPDC002055 TaxID=3154534 RepID=UPI003316D58F